MTHDSFLSFFKNLFSQDFMPHGHCYFWRPEILWLNAISDGLIALSYYAIPFILFFFMRKRKDFPFPWVLAMFGGFILLCGTTHLMSIITLWNPMYRLDGIIKAATALISVLTTLMLIPLIPLALALKSPKELEAANMKLAKANEKLKEIDRLKDSFFSNISHELRTPLTLILGPLESFLNNDCGSFTKEQRKYLEAMHNNSIRLFQMVNSILDFAKISAKKIEVNRGPVDLVLLTQSITKEFEPFLQSKHIKLQFTCPETKKIVNMDRYLYERILFNLLSNAAKFTPEKGSIFISLEFKGDKAKLSLRDTGIGISAENQKKLFQRFQQVEGSSTRRFEGTGLGLALVKEFAVLLGGNVKLKSDLGQGSTFIVEVHAPKATAKTQALIQPIESKSRRFTIPIQKIEFASQNDKTQDSAKIVIAEDNLELAAYIGSLLSEFALVKHAKDGEEAWDLINSWEPDLALLDIMMPKRDGISLCKEIKASGKTAHISVILLTALTHRDALVRGWRAGANEYLFKPFHPKELVTRIKLLLDQSRNNMLVQELNRKLITTARLAGMSEVAANILHNVGNVLNSVSIDGHLLLNKLSKSSLSNLVELNQWMKKMLDDPKEFIKNTKAQENFLSYLAKLNESLLMEQKEWINDIRNLNKNIEHIEEIIAQQQKIEGPYGVVEEVQISVLLDELIKDHLAYTDEIKVIKHYDEQVKARLDKMKLHQILENLILNAKESLLESSQNNKQLKISLHIKMKDKQEWVEIEISDNGLGISKEHLSEIFIFGYTTKADRSGFGLHLSSLSAQKMDGKLIAHSQGKNQGATFILSLPTQPLHPNKWVTILQ